MARFRKALIVEQNKEYVAKIREMLSSVVEDVISCLDGQEAIRLYDFHKPDLILVEAILPKLDGFAVLEHIDDKSVVKIMLTSINKDIIVRKAFELGADYLFVKPYDKDNFVKWICEIQDYKLHGGKRPVTNTPSGEDLRMQITNTLKQFGIPAKIKGYGYLREALLIACNDFSTLDSINKNIYQVLAMRFETTDKCIERNIRHAIETSANRGDIEAYYRYFGFSVDSNKGKPTNGEFIAAIADKILLQND